MQRPSGALVVLLWAFLTVVLVASSEQHKSSHETRLSGTKTPNSATYRTQLIHGGTS